mgnify:CR=1 FL=1
MRRGLQLRGACDPTFVKSANSLSFSPPSVPVFNERASSTGKDAGGSCAKNMRHPLPLELRSLLMCALFCDPSAPTGGLRRLQPSRGVETR